MDEEREMLQGRDGETYWWFPGRRLGQGGYGEVFEAVTIDGLPHAVKRVPLRQGSTSRWYAEARLAERELQVSGRLGRVTDKNVMPLVDDVLLEDALLLVMPRADYSLHQVLAEGRRLDEAETRALLMDLARGLAYLAQRAVVHRDIKPGNILWWGGRWVISDLGIARIQEVDTSTYTWAGTGTPEYSAPELFSHEPATVATDLYALGCVAVAALTGSPPFDGENLSRSHRLETPNIPRLGDVALERTIRRLLSKAPSARPADARMVQQLLEPQGSLGDDQAAMLRAAARTARRKDERERQAMVDRELENRRDDALAALDALVEDTATRARQMLPSTSSLRQGDTWFITAEEAGARLSVQVAEPSRRSDYLLLGVVIVAFMDEMEQSAVANLLCQQEGGHAIWKLALFEHNAMAPERPPLGPRRARRGAALSLQHLDGLLDQLQRLGAPPLLMQTEPLTPLSLLSELAAELDASADRE